MDKTIDGFQTENQEDYSDTTMEVQAVRLALPGFYSRLRHMWWFSNHQVGQVGFPRVLRFPPTKTQNTDNENDFSLFHNRCLINYIFLIEVYCFYVWSILSWSCYFCMDFCCIYVCGFGFNTTGWVYRKWSKSQIGLYNEDFIIHVCLIMWRFILVHTWFWDLYQLDKSIKMVFHLKLVWMPTLTDSKYLYIFLYLYSPQQCMGRTSKSTVYGQNI